MAKKVDEAQGVFKFIGEQSLRSITTVVQTIRGRMDKARGELGAALKGAEKDKNLHLPAYKQAEKLSRMDAPKLRAWLAHFDYYREKFKLDKLAEAAGDFEVEGDKASGDKGLEGRQAEGSA